MLSTVRARIFVFALLVVLALAALGTVSWTIIAQASRATDALVNQGLNQSWQLADLEQDLRQVQDLSYRIKAQLLLWEEINAGFEDVQTRLSTHWQTITGNPGLEEWGRAHQEAFGEVQSLLQAMSEGISAKSYYQVGKVVDFRLMPAIDPMLSAIGEQQARQRSNIERDSGRLLAFLERQGNYLAAGAVAFLVLVLLMTLWLRHTVILRLRRTEASLRNMEATSDLRTVPAMTGRDEVAGVASAIGSLVARLAGFLQEVRGAALSLDERARVLEEGAETVQAASGHTRDQVGDVADSMQEITAQADTVEQAVHQSRSTITLAVEGNRDVQGGLKRSEKAADNTVHVIGEVSGAIQVLSSSTGKVEQVVSVIAEIAEQTNLLALNAAIEAARAGEHGRGFAVVADEVRTLSRRTADSTGEIRQWVDDLVANVGGIEQRLLHMQEAGNENTREINKLKEYLENLDESFSTLGRLSQDIDGAISTQRENIERVGRRTRALTESAEQLVGAVDQTRDVSDSLRREAGAIRGMVGRFRVDEA